MSDRISSFAQPLQQEYLLQAMQSQLNNVAGEVSSGQVTNPAAAMGNNAASLYQLQSEANQQSTLNTTATTAGNRLSAIQDALTSISTAAQTVSNASIGGSTTDPNTYSTIADQAQSTMSQVLSLLNTQYEGSSLFAGDATNVQPMQSTTATGGPEDTINTVLNAAVTANGGQPLTSANVSSLLTGPNGLSSVFSNTNSNPALNYNGSFYTAPDDGQPTTVPIGLSQTVQYSVQGDQPAFKDLLQGLSMLTMLSAPSTQLDSTAQAAILTQANTLIGQAQNELTTTQGQLGTVQTQLTQVATAQQTASTNTTAQISSLESTNMTADSEQLSNLQTQLEASYQVTALVSQLTLSHYLPTLTS
jgi:flagellar hook-associated protein 3 FlgL